MNDSLTDKEHQLESDSRIPGERLVYVMSEKNLRERTDDELNLYELWNILWRGKWIIIAVTALFAVSSVLYALAQTHWYRAEVLLAPADAKSTPALSGQLGGLAALAGVSVGGGSSAESLATLRSRNFAREFVEEFDLLPVFYSDTWDAQRGVWLVPDNQAHPDIRDGIKFFHDNVLRVSEDRQTLLVTVAIEWPDPVLAATWAEAVVQRLNNRLRERALREAEANVAYLQQELANTQPVTLQQSIGRLLETELQKLMLARGNEEFAFRVIDPAVVPKAPSRPRRTVIAILGTVLGGMLGIFAVFILHVVRGYPNAKRASI